MHVIYVHNVCEALPTGVELLLSRGEQEDSRAGPVLVAPKPVTTVYLNPCQRVLFSPVRDANPFFHLAEALWMLAGRNDAKFLNLFVKDFGERFAETDGTVHGAYGHRWRKALGFDQLDHVVATLKRDPTSRQCVIQMWDASPEACTGYDDLRGSWKDRPCNTHIYLRVREDKGWRERGDKFSHVLDITVPCRSNDIIWGAYGSNAVHFSILQEYLAARIGVGVGRYYQISNNYHAYVGELERLGKRAGAALDMGKPRPQLAGKLQDNRYGAHIAPEPLVTEPLVSDPATFDQELYELLCMVETQSFHRNQARQWRNSFLRDTVYWMLIAHRFWRDGDKSILDMVGFMGASDWRTACAEWFERRMLARQVKEVTTT